MSMKITLSAAMRARDVSRPRADQLAEAASREEPRAAAGGEARAARRDPAQPAAPDAPQPRGRRRRRRPR